MIWYECLPRWVAERMARWAKWSKNMNIYIQMYSSGRCLSVTWCGFKYCMKLGSTRSLGFRWFHFPPNIYKYIYIYIYTYTNIYIYMYSSGRLCTLIGVPCRLSMLSTFSTFANVLFQYKSPRAEGAKTDPRQGTPMRVRKRPPEYICMW